MVMMSGGHGGTPRPAGVPEVGAWSAVMPVKPLAMAKSRLGPAAGSAHRRQRWALAFAVDTARAVLRSPLVARLVVVTDDAVAAAALRSLGAIIVADLPRSGLNPALAHGAGHAAAIAPEQACCVLSADLPALRPGELTGALAAAARHRRAFVADAAGTGTTLLAAADPRLLGPRFGVASASAHAASGAVPLEGSWPGLRQDVDAADQLHSARRLGVGAATAAALTD